jgi:hypothetical protein
MKNHQNLVTHIVIRMNVIIPNITKLKTKPYGDHALKYTQVPSLVMFQNQPISSLHKSFFTKPNLIAI